MAAVPIRRFRWPRGPAAWVPGLFALAFIAPHVWIVVTGRESWPLTCAPMFAHRLQRDEDVFAFRYLVVDGQGGRRELGYRELGLPPWRSWRFFFTHVYGSIDPGYPVHTLPDDRPETFAARIGRYLDGLAELTRQRLPGHLDGAVAIELVLDRVDPRQRTTGTTLVGTYDLEGRRFEHHPPGARP